MSTEKKLSERLERHSNTPLEQVEQGLRLRVDLLLAQALHAWGEEVAALEVRASRAEALLSRVHAAWPHGVGASVMREIEALIVPATEPASGGKAADAPIHKTIVWKRDPSLGSFWDATCKCGWFAEGFTSEPSATGHALQHERQAQATPDALGEAIEKLEQARAVIADTAVPLANAQAHADIDMQKALSLLHQARAAHAETEGANHLLRITRRQQLEVYQKVIKERDATRAEAEALKAQRDALNAKLDAACPSRCPRCGETAAAVEDGACAKCLLAKLAQMERETIGLRRFTCLWCGHQSEWTEDAAKRDAEEREHALTCEKGPVRKNEALRHQLSAARAEVEALKKERDEIRVAHTEMKRSREELRSTQSELKRLCSHYEMQAHRATQDLHEIKARAVASEDAANAAYHERDAANARAEKLSETLCANNTEAAGIRIERDALRSKLEWMTANRDGFHAARDHAEEEAKRLRSQLAAAQAEATNLRSALKYVSAELHKRYKDCIPVVEGDGLIGVVDAALSPAKENS